MTSAVQDIARSASEYSRVAAATAGTATTTMSDGLPKLTEIAVTLIGIALVVCAVTFDGRWLDAHFLPSFFVSRSTYVLVESLARIVTAAIGVAAALFLRRRIGNFVARAHGPTLLAPTVRVAFAVVLACGTSEAILRQTYHRAAEEVPAWEEPLRHSDRRLGWVFVPARTGIGTVAGRVVEYAFDPAGYRVRHADQPVDPERPTVVFTGESVMVGEALTWEESVPGQVEALMNTQSANLAVSGFATDQAYLRLLEELPRFRQPRAVVSLFTPALFDRNLNSDRPHLDPGLVWLPPEPRWRLAALADLLLPYRSQETIERGIAVTRAVLRSTIDLARMRGAVPLIVVPQFMPEEPTERLLRRRILDEDGIPYLLVELDSSWRVPRDWHPDSRAAHAMAAAIATRLHER
ncbi:MAG TPA: hypothetical protein VE422_38985 [Terriglobia bacterium]|nr:hypothetical protein [Terriglobia bacterium]